MSVQPSRLCEAIELQQTLMAGEIHDSLLPYLFATRMRLETLVSRLDDQPREIAECKSLVRQELNLAIGTLQEAMQIGRQLLGELYSSDLAETPWTELLLSTTDSDDVKLIIHGDADCFLSDLDCRVVARRIAQESIRNAVRHGHASTVVVSVQPAQGKQVELLIHDDGHGFDAAQSSQGYGLRLMRSRAKLVDASLTISSRIGGPTQVLVVFAGHEATGAD